MLLLPLLLDFTVRDDSIVRHYKIWQNPQGNLYMNVVFSFPDLRSLVEHYKAKNLSHGLRLTIPCWKVNLSQPRTARMMLVVGTLVGEWVRIWQGKLDVFLHAGLEVRWAQYRVD